MLPLLLNELEIGLNLLIGFSCETECLWYDPKQRIERPTGNRQNVILNRASKTWRSTHLVFSIKITELLCNNRIIWIERLFRQTAVNDNRHNDAMILDCQMHYVFKCIDIILKWKKQPNRYYSGIKKFIIILSCSFPQFVQFSKNECHNTYLSTHQNAKHISSFISIHALFTCQLE